MSDPIILLFDIIICEVWNGCYISYNRYVKCACDDKKAHYLYFNTSVIFCRA